LVRRARREKEEEKELKGLVGWRMGNHHKINPDWGGKKTYWQEKKKERWMGRQAQGSGNDGELALECDLRVIKKLTGIPVSLMGGEKPGEGEKDIARFLAEEGLWLRGCFGGGVGGGMNRVGESLGGMGPQDMTLMV